MNILLIDDDVLLSETIVSALKRIGDDTICCNNVEDAIIKIRDIEFDIYIVDLMLPPSFSIEGVSLLQQIKSMAPSKEVLMISSKSVGMTSIVDQAYQLGARRFIDKGEPTFLLNLITIVKEVELSMNNAVFISHGHADLLKLKLKDFINNTLGIPTVILSELPNEGMTIVEKLESASKRCNKAIILLTKDDKAENGMRARQNVIHEVGFFQGKYGRKNVVLLCESGVELFSNISGIVRIEFESNHFEECYEQIRREFRIV